LLENLLDLVRRGEMPLRREMVDIFLETKDVLTDQVLAYRDDRKPDLASYQRICAQLRALAQTPGASRETGAASPVRVAMTGSAPASDLPPVSAQPAFGAETAGVMPVCVRLSRLSGSDAEKLSAEMALLGTILHQAGGAPELAIWLDTSVSEQDLAAVCCFIVNEDQVRVTREPVPAENTASAGPGAGREQPRAASSSGTLRVSVEKVDQIINLVGELVITQAMLAQTSSSLDAQHHDRLLNGIEQLERNARDLQEAVMSIRMMPMDYVFNRFPRVVRETAAKLGKQIRLITEGAATELDKSLIERIIDPLTHLVRNSIDHGIEPPDVRVASGKQAEGSLTLSARHHGGQIIIEVSDDGAGLNRERILRKAVSLGMPVGESTPDEELWQLVFSPGFSTADTVTDISGRGVGMDVVRRNIQSMGGHIQLSSRQGEGTTTRIVLPLTLAILDGMSVGVGKETFILPLSHVTESIQPASGQLRKLSETEHVLFVRGEYLPLVPLHEVFKVDGAQTDITQSIAVILQTEEARFALQVDHLIGQHQVVVKSLESNYRKVPGVSAATILGDGSVALIADVFALMRFSRDRSAL
jgi:two-component system chemotaxis sensor kinase CheA